MGYLNIKDGCQVYADTSVFIYTVESHPEYWSLLQPLWEKFDKNLIEIYNSELTLLEVLINSIKNEDNLLINDYEKLLLNTDICLISINKSILRASANLRAKSKIKTPDAIHIATALSLKCDLFLTNDLNLKNIQ
jgi:predicted nucleic acid-binding protein